MTLKRLHWIMLFIIMVIICVTGAFALRKAPKIHYLIISASNYKAKVYISKSDEWFDQVIKKKRPFAAINGTYYDENQRPLGYLISNGKMLNRGGYKNAVYITKNNQVKLISKVNKRFNFKNVDFAVSCGPRLLKNGAISFNPESEGFSKKTRILSDIRSGIGVTNDGKLIIATSKESMTLKEFANELLKAGAKDAINLDGGSVSGFYVKDRASVLSFKPVNNLILIYEK